MPQTGRIVQWNQWYDRAPSDWRFQFVLWPLLALGTINLLLSVRSGFPFALLVVLGIVCISAVRVPYLLGWIKPADSAVAADAEPATFQIEGASWIVDLNQRYEAMPEARRFWVFPAILIIAGAINMLLTIGQGFPFGLLFLLALLALVAIRAPYAVGWIRPAAATGDGTGLGDSRTTAVEHTPVRALTSESTPDTVQTPIIHTPEPVHVTPLHVTQVPPTEQNMSPDFPHSTDQQTNRTAE